MRKHVAVVTLVALLLASGPVSLAQLGGLDSPTRKLVPERRSVWPSGTIEEVWHGPRDLSLHVTNERGAVEIHLTGDEFHVEMQVTIEGETRSIDFEALLESHAQGAPPGRELGSGDAARAGRGRTAGEVDNEAVLAWIDEKAGAAFRLADVDRAHLDETFLGAVLEKGGCEGRVRNALSATSVWLACIAAMVASAGAGYIPCVLIGLGAFYMGLAALEACDPGGGTGPIKPNDPLGCSCTGDAPDCMCCLVDPGDVCTCYCPGEACCFWEDNRRTGR